MLHLEFYALSNRNRDRFVCCRWILHCFFVASYHIFAIVGTCSLERVFFGASTEIIIGQSISFSHAITNYCRLSKWNISIKCQMSAKCILGSSSNSSNATVTAPSNHSWLAAAMRVNDVELNGSNNKTWINQQYWRRSTRTTTTAPKVSEPNENQNKTTPKHPITAKCTNFRWQLFSHSHGSGCYCSHRMCVRIYCVRFKLDAHAHCSGEWVARLFYTFVHSERNWNTHRKNNVNYRILWDKSFQLTLLLSSIGISRFVLTHAHTNTQPYTPRQSLWHEAFFARAFLGSVETFVLFPFLFHSFQTVSDSFAVAILRRLSVHTYSLALFGGRQDGFAQEKRYNIGVDVWQKNNFFNFVRHSHINIST